MQRNIKLYMLFNFLLDLRFDAAILILYFTHVTGSFVAGMSIFSVNTLSAALFEVPTGIFSDMIGRRKTIIFGAASITIALVLYALGTSYWLLFLGALFEGLSRAFFSGNNEALLHDTVSDTNQLDRFAEYLGKASSMSQLALMFGSLIGGFASLINFKVVMSLSVFSQLACFIIAWFFIEPRTHHKESTNIYSHFFTSLKYLYKNKKLRLLTFAQAIDFGIGESSWQFRSAFVNSVWPVWGVGLYKTFSHFSNTISFWFSGSILKKFGAFPIIIFSGVLYRVVNITGLLLRNFFSPFIMLISASTYGLSTTASSKLLHKEFTDSERATLQSIGSFMGNIIFALYAPLIGYLGDLLGPANALLVSHVFHFPVLMINYHLFKNHNHER